MLGLGPTFAYRRRVSFSSLLLHARALALGTLAAAASAGCAVGVSTGEAPGVGDAQVASAVVVADPRATAAAEVDADHVRLPSAVAERYRAMPAGAIFVGARGSTTGRNPDGFLRRVVSVADEGGALVVTTTPATLTDAIVRGALKTSSGERGIDGEGASEQSIRPLAREQLRGIAVDFSDPSLFAAVDEVTVGSNRARFVEKVRLDRAVMTAKPVVDLDVRIEDGKVSRFVAKVEGNLDTSVRAHASVTAEGDVDAAILSELRTRRHDVERVIFKSSRIALPTFAVAGVPVSPAVQFTVTLRCSLAFGGALEADAGVEARSYVRLGGIYQDGEWLPPIRSTFDIRPSFDLQRGGEIDARCAIDASAELSAYGVGGVVLGVTPYVDFDVSAASGPPSVHRYTVKAGATGNLRGRAEIFGVDPAGFERQLTEWQSPVLLEGVVPVP